MNPTITVGPGAASGASASIVGDDTLGLISFSMSGTGNAGHIFEVTFGSAYSAAPGSVRLLPISGPSVVPGIVSISAGIWQFDPQGMISASGAQTWTWVYRLD